MQEKVSIRGDELIVKYYQKNRYHPRSSKHGDKLSELLLQDIINLCDEFRDAASRSEIVYTLNHKINENTAQEWNLDLVIGPPQEKQSILNIPGKISKGIPSEVYLAMDTKSLMTEHGKARRNRQRDMNALHQNVHLENPTAIAAGLMVINIADRFRSPLRPEGEITTHHNVKRLVEESVELFRGVSYNDNITPSEGIDAMGVIVISHTNLRENPTTLIKESPSPSPEDRLEYLNFIDKICKAMNIRFFS